MAGAPGETNMPQQINQVYEFGPFRLHAGERLLLRGPETVPVAPKALDLLLILVENHGRVLEKNFLMKTVWPETFVEEGNLSRNVFHLRKMLGDGFIQTLPKRGYRFVGQVRMALDTTAVLEEHSVSRVTVEEVSRPFWRIVFGLGCVVAAALGLYLFLSTRSHQEARSLAVLPLRSLDGETRDDHLELGMADTIIGKLSQIRELTVRPISAVAQFSQSGSDAVEIGRQLKVDSVLEGTLQRSGDRLRVRVNLISVRGGASLWSEIFDVGLSDIFSVQDQVAQQVASRMNASLTPEERNQLSKHSTSNPAAYEYYVAGLHYFDQRSLIKMGPAIPMFQKAIELDPNYALANAQLAYSYTWMALFIEPDNPDWLRHAKVALERAEKLDHNQPETHIVRYQWLWSIHGNFRIDEAIREVRQAQALRPEFHNELGILLAHLGLEAQSLREMRAAIEGDPLSSHKKASLVEAHTDLGLFEEALNVGSRFGLATPEVRSLLALERLDQAEPLIRAQVAESPRAPRVRATEALLLALRGRYSEAEGLIPEIRKGWKDRGYHHAAEALACVFALQGKARDAVTWLQTAADTGMPNYTLFQREPHLARIRSSPEFIHFMAELKPRWQNMTREFR
jgi:TolB-like protein/DNA-binding winged helix-turn-helix (wHTH) protein/tetratricopeptide (TPR) repeat protein